MNVVLRSTGDLGNMFFEWAMMRRLTAGFSARYYWDPADMKVCELERIGLPISRMPEHLRKYTPISSQCGSSRRFVYPIRRRLGTAMQIVSDTMLKDNTPSRYGIFVHGRFQDAASIDWDICDELLGAVRNQCPGFNPESKSLLGIHVRRGDYTEQYWSNRLGLLSTDYFRQAVSLVTVPYDGIKIFTDSPKNAEVLRLAQEWGAEISSNSSRYEDMYEMSQCGALVVSNSTFSLWSALMGGEGVRQVVAPNPWFRNSETENRLPEQFTLCSSNWT